VSASRRAGHRLPGRIVLSPGSPPVRGAPSCLSKLFRLSGADQGDHCASWSCRSGHNDSRSPTGSHRPVSAMAVRVVDVLGISQLPSVSWAAALRERIAPRTIKGLSGSRTPPPSIVERSTTGANQMDGTAQSGNPSRPRRPVPFWVGGLPHLERRVVEVQAQYLSLWRPIADFDDVFRPRNRRVRGSNPLDRSAPDRRWNRLGLAICQISGVGSPIAREPNNRPV